MKVIIGILALMVLTQSARAETDTCSYVAKAYINALKSDKKVADKYDELRAQIIKDMGTYINPVASSEEKFDCESIEFSSIRQDANSQYTSNTYLISHKFRYAAGPIFANESVKSILLIEGGNGGPDGDKPVFSDTTFKGFVTLEPVP